MYIRFDFLQQILLYVWCTFVAMTSIYWFVCYTYLSSHKNFLSHAQDIFQNSYLVKDLQKNFLTSESYSFSNSYLAYLIALFSLFFISLLVILRKANKEFNPETEKETSFYTKKQKTNIFMFFCLWLLFKHYSINFLPLHIDEVFDFQFFSKSNFITRHSYQFCDGKQWYNNHVLYSDLSAFLYIIGLPINYAMRLPSVLGEFFVLVSIVHFIRFKKNIYLFFVLCIIVSSFWLAIYSLEARSYYLLGTCSLCSFFILNKMYAQPYTSGFYSLILLNSFGFALCKLYILPFFGIIMYFVLGNPSSKNLKWFFEMILGTTLLTLLFYFPVFLLGGIKSIYNTSTNRSFLEEMMLFPDFLEIISVITNLNSKSYLLLLLIPACFIVRNRLSISIKQLLYFNITQLMALIIFTLILGTFLPSRLFIYLNLSFSLFLAFFCIEIAQKTKFPFFLLTIIYTLLLVNSLYNLCYGWIINYPKNILDTSYYSQINQCLDEVEKENPKDIFIPSTEHFLGFNALTKLSSDIKINMSDEFKGEELYFSKTIINKKNYYLFSKNKALDIYIFKKKPF